MLLIWPILQLHCRLRQRMEETPVLAFSSITKLDLSPFYITPLIHTIDLIPIEVPSFKYNICALSGGKIPGKLLPRSSTLSWSCRRFTYFTSICRLCQIEPQLWNDKEMSALYFSFFSSWLWSWRKKMCAMERCK